MSETADDGANEPHDGAQADGDDETTVREVEWTEAQAGFRNQLEQRREVAVEIPGLASDGETAIATFELRPLEQDEQDEAEQAAAKVRRQDRARGRGGGDPEIDVDTSALRDVFLKYGIVRGPDGFKPHREDHRAALPAKVKDRLVEEIDDMSSLDVVEKDAFPGVGSG